MKKIGWFHNLLIAIVVILTFSSCSKDEDLDSSDIIGTWYGTRAYNNPASGTKYQYLNVTFESNGTGELEYSAPSSYSYAAFEYKISKDKILCNGYFATDAYEMDSAEKFEMTLSIEGNRLIPLDRYSYFILTKDNSVITDGDGKEIVDDSNLLNNVWIRDDGYSVCVIDNGKCTEYILLEQNGKIYQTKDEYDVSYDSVKKEIWFGLRKYDVITLTASILEIKSDKYHFIFKAGTANDIPMSGENGDDDDIKALLCSAFTWKTNDGKYFNFYKPNGTTYMENSYRNLGSVGQISMAATGTFSLKDKQLTCNYTEVEWEYGNDLTKDWFPGWTYGEPRTRKFIIKSISGENLTLEDEDGKIYMTTPL